MSGKYVWHKITQSPIQTGLILYNSCQSGILATGKVLGSSAAYVFHKAFCDYGGSCIKSNKLPHMVTWVLAEDYKFDDEENRECGLEISFQTFEADTA